MSKISQSKVSNTVEVKFPDLEGFYITVKYLDRDELTKIRNKSMKYKFNKRTRQKEEEVDNDKFLELYSREAIISWKGLKVKYLPELFPSDISSLNPDDEIAYEEEEALDLLKTSIVFDNFITETQSDLDLFSITNKETTIKN